MKGGTTADAGPGGPPRGPAGAPAGAGRLGMILFLIALGMLFAGAMVSYLVVRLRAVSWPPAGSPRLPEGLWISTLILLVSSVTMVAAVRSIREGREAALRKWLLGTAFLAIAFLVSQILNWVHLISAQDLPAQSNLYAFTFYMLSGLHGAHVVGGLVPLGVTVSHAGKGRYSANSHEGVKLLSMYWHFLDAVWVVMFVLLVVAA